MNEIYKLSDVKGDFFSPISIIVSIGLIGVGISLCKNMISKHFNGLIVRGR